MRPKHVKIFTFSAALLLLAMGTAELIGNQGKGLIQPADPAFGFSTRYLFWILAGIQISVVVLCLWDKFHRVQVLLLLWLAFNLILYRLFLFSQGIKDINAYFDPMAASFGISGQTASWFITIATGYLFVGSCASLVAQFKNGKAAIGENTKLRPL